jgi:hypothetical protein
MAENHTSEANSGSTMNTAEFDAEVTKAINDRGYISRDELDQHYVSREAIEAEVAKRLAELWTGSLGTQRIGCPKCGVASGYTVIAVTVVIGLNVMS